MRKRWSFSAPYPGATSFKERRKSFYLWLRDVIGPGLAISTCIWFGILLSERVLTTRDLGATHLPWRGEWARQVAHGWVPLWHPNANGGRPLWADPNSQGAYPFTALFLLAPPWAAMTLFLASHHLWFMAGLAFLARRAGAPSAFASAAGAILATSGVAFSLTTFPNSLASASWLPWAWGLLLAREKEKPVGGLTALGAGGILGLSFLAGEPVTASLGLVGALFLSAFSRERVKTSLIVLLGFVLVAAPVLVPLLDFFPESARGAIKVSWEALAADSLAPRRWLELLFPRVLGTPLGDGSTGFWAAPSFPWQRYYPLVFLGGATLALVLLGIQMGGHRGWWWGMLFLAGFILAALPAWPWGLRWLRDLPGGEFWRFAIKGLQLSVFAAAPLVAKGLGRSLRCQRFVFGGLAVALLVPSFFPAYLRWPLGQLYPASAQNLAQVDEATWRTWWLADGLTNALPLAFLALWPRPHLVALSATLVQWPLFFTVHELVPNQQWTQAPRILLENRLPPHSWILVSWEAQKIKSRNPPWSLAFRDRLIPDYGWPYGLSYALARGPDGLEPLAGELLAAAANKLSGEELVHLGASLGAQVVLLAPREAHRGCSLWEDVAVCLPSRASPPVYLARRGLPAQDLATGLAWLSSEAFVPGEDVTLASLEIPTSFGAGSVAELPGSPAHRRFLVHAQQSTLLVVNQNFTRGWRAQVDGQAAAVERANFARLGVRVPGGVHRVELYLDPKPYLLGGLGPLVFLASLGALQIRGRKVANCEKVRSSPAMEPGLLP